jgi:hypothetical protein
MRSRLLLLALLLAALQPRLALATIRLVPGVYPTIQSGINAAQNGDTVSVWGPPLGQNAPPYIYHENIVFPLNILNLTVANRSFLCATPCPPSWDSVRIIAANSGPTVTMAFNPLVLPWRHATLRGFTIRNPYGAQNGAGIRAGNGVITIADCHIDSCVAAADGGGIHYAYTRQDQVPDTVRVSSCLVENCRAPGTATSGRGGGIFVAVAAQGLAVIQGNRVLGNYAGRLGGGLFVSQWYEGAPGYPYQDTTIRDNWVEFDTAGVSGGGIYTDNCQGHAKRNVVVRNQPDGFYLKHPCYQNPPLSLGETSSPGFNVLMDNVGDYDLVVDVSQHLLGTCHANGTYWGSLNTASIWSRIWRVHPEYDSFSIGPSVAASGKWFSVTENSTCSTDVIVTGDLRVDSGVELSIEPHSTFEFATEPDASLPGGDPDLTDLILSGQGSSLQAIGSRDLGGIKFTSRPTAGSPGADRWYGIRLKPGSNATLMYCNVDSAYCGVEVESAFAEIESSWVHDCEFAGVYNLVDGHVNVLGSEVEDNGVYGVRCEFSAEPEEPSRVDANHLRGNGHAGVSFTCAAPTDDVPHRILYNGIVAGDTGQYGVEISSASDSVMIGSNHISGFPQAGLACFDQAHPYVRWNTVDSNQDGVFCDPSSLPDLGTEEDPGNNSILLGNAIWVRQADISTGWTAPDSLDTFLSGIGLFLVVVRAEIAQTRVPPPAIVEQFDVFDNCCFGLQSGPKPPLVD